MADNSRYVRKTISLDPEIYELAVSNAKQRGFKTSFSAYVAWLIERDAKGGVERENLRKTPPGKVTYLQAEEEPPKH